MKFLDVIEEKQMKVQFLTKFNESYFTSDPAELEKALAGIKIADGGDYAETSSPALTQIVSTYDWSKSPKIKSLSYC